MGRLCCVVLGRLGGCSLWGYSFVIPTVFTQQSGTQVTALAVFVASEGVLKLVPAPRNGSIHALHREFEMVLQRVLARALEWRM